MNGTPDFHCMSSKKILVVVCFFATHIDNLSNTATSADEQKFSHEKDDPDRISVMNLCVNSERLCSATGPRLHPPRRRKERQKDSDYWRDLCYIEGGQWFQRLSLLHCSNRRRDS